MCRSFPQCRFPVPAAAQLELSLSWSFASGSGRAPLPNTNPAHSRTRRIAQDHTMTYPREVREWVVEQCAAGRSFADISAALGGRPPERICRQFWSDYCADGTLEARGRVAPRPPPRTASPAARAWAAGALRGQANCSRVSCRAACAHAACCLHACICGACCASCALQTVLAVNPCSPVMLWHE